MQRIRLETSYYNGGKEKMRKVDSDSSVGDRKEIKVRLLAILTAR